MKTYTGIELLQAIKEGEIKDKTEFWFSCNIGQGRYKFCRNDGSFFDIYNDNRNIMADYDLLEIANGTFELIEENQDIDIQSIEEQGYDEFTSLEVYKRIQELIQAIKQLDRQINNT